MKVLLDTHAFIWWDNLVQSRIEDGYPPIVTWIAHEGGGACSFCPTQLYSFSL